LRDLSDETTFIAGIKKDWRKKGALDVLSIAKPEIFTLPLNLYP